MSAELAENLPPPPTSEVDRFEAQRQAFSRLMARFTADRDAMIAAVQQCNERLDSLALRFTGTMSGEAPAEGAEAAANAGLSGAGLAEVRSLTERMLAQQQQAVAEVRTASDRALQRADDAQRRVRDLGDLASQREAAAEELRQAVDTFDDRLARLEEAFLSVDDKEAPVAAATDDEAARLLNDRVASVEEHLHALAEAVEHLRQVERSVPAEDATPAPLMNLGLRDLREQMANLEGLVAWTPKLQRLWVSLVASAVVAAAAVAFVR